MEYRRQEQSGCGGCFPLILLLIFLVGGAPLVFRLVGFLLFGLFLLVVSGVVAFFGFSYYVKRKIGSYERSQTESHNTFVFLLVHILVKIAQVDGEVTRQEINIIHRFFRENLHYAGDRMYWIKDLVREALQSPASLDELLAEFKGKFAYEPRLILLELIYRVIFTKEEISDSELDLARSIARFLVISAADLRTIESRYFGFKHAAAAAERSDESRYFEILGLQTGASFAEIKSSYRKLSMQYHPDKVGHLGEEFQKVAEEKMKEINVAYEFLRKRFG